MTSEIAIRTDALSKRYGKTTALDGLTMTVPRGEVFGFLGPNGAGKTTSIRLLLGLARPTSGTGEVLGKPLGDRETRRHIGYLPELFRYQHWMRATEVIEFHCSLLGIGGAWRKSEIERIVGVVGLKDRASDRVGTYSKGMQQRLGIGLALLGEPQLVFLDEPTSALDPVGRHDVRAIIADLAAKGVTVFLNSHLLSEVERICTRLAVMNRGHIIALGTTEEVIGRHQAVHITCNAGKGTAQEIASKYGDASVEADVLTVRGINDDKIADLVDALVAGGIRLHAVIPQTTTLEEKFLQLLSERDGE